MPFYPPIYAILQIVRREEIAAMPILEEEIRALKGALSVMESRHLSDVQQLREQLNALQRQLDEQQGKFPGKVIFSAVRKGAYPSI
jgi:rubrerythrin